MQLAVLAVLCAGALASTVQEANNFMDTVLHEQMQKYPKLDPMDARGRYVKLGNLIRSDWTADIDNVKVIGLSRVNRSGRLRRSQDAAVRTRIGAMQSSPGPFGGAVHVAPALLGRSAGRVPRERPRFPRPLASLHSEVGARRYPDVKLTVRSKPEPTLSYANLGNLTENRPMRVGYAYASSDTLHRTLQKDYVDYLTDAMVSVPVPNKA
ncbi:hypothetical protein MRX96_035256 [Rhipicephalus microplus]